LARRSDFSDAGVVVSRVILTSGDMSRIVDRLSHQILETGDGIEDATLVGIRTRGVPMSQRLAQRMAAFGAGELPTEQLDVTAYRDDRDLRRRPSAGNTTLLPARVTGRRVILVDDVLFSGRTVRAALDAVTSLGRPRLVQLAVLIDRGHRELPIRADYIGKNIPTSRRERVQVCFRETDECDEVRLVAADGVSP
jgi:pyrimidine operon attenuation protein/uracil phosphoribosyltransferase